MKAVDNSRRHEQIFGFKSRMRAAAEAGTTAWLYHSEFEMAIAIAIANASVEAAID